jgi:hypothetical protein
MDTIMRNGTHETRALEIFLLSCKQTYTELNPAVDLDHAEADQAIQELREGLRL